MFAVMEERMTDYLDAIDRAECERRIKAVLPSGWELTRIAHVRGHFAALFMVEIGTNSYKGFGTSWYDSETELLSIVLDTLEHIHLDLEGDYNVNIYSADMFEYLSAEMLPTGKTVSLTIKSVIQEVIAGPRGESNKVTISFVERPKKLILNKTNARTLAKTLGPETDNWRGAVVVLGVENVKVGRNTVPSVRVKSATPAPSAHTDAGQGEWLDEIDEHEQQAEPA